MGDIDIADINFHADQFLSLLHKIGKTDPANGRLGSRELSLAQTKIEEAVMWAKKHGG